MEIALAKSQFIQAWGALGSSWGINRTMAQIHALMLISTEALSTEEIMEDLKISRGNANMNVRALMDWGLVFKELRAGERKEFFYCDKDIWSVARKVARERKRRELEPVMEVLRQMKNVEGDGPEIEEFKKMTGEIADFANQVDGLLDKFSRSDANWFYKTALMLIR